MSEQAVAARTWSEEIKALGTKIVGLTLMQAKELADYLKEVHGIEPAGGAVAIAAAPAAGGGAAAPAAEEKTAFDVILKAAGEKKIQVIKVVRAATNLGLKEAKDLVDAAPKPIKQAIAKAEAEELKKQLEEAGATVELA